MGFSVLLRNYITAVAVLDAYFQEIRKKRVEEIYQLRLTPVIIGNVFRFLYAGIVHHFPEIRDLRSAKFIYRLIFVSDHEEHRRIILAYNQRFYYLHLQVIRILKFID